VPAKSTSPKVASPAADAYVMELEPAAAKPAPDASAAAPEPAQQEPEPRPFFGGAPDDPGVKNLKLEPEPKTRLKLF
jgi:HemY protein